MIILGIDPHVSKPYAMTLLNGDAILMQAKGDVKTLDVVLSAYKVDVVAVEDQYLNRNYSTAKGLSWSAGKVMGVAELRGVRVVVVNVASWKAYFHVMKGGHVKASVLRRGLEDDDLASSHLIALYALEVEGDGPKWLTA